MRALSAATGKPVKKTLIREDLWVLVETKEDGSARNIGLELLNPGKELAAKLLVYQAANSKDEHKPYTHLAAMAKLVAAQNASDVTRRCLQLFGGYGYIRDYPIERMMRDAKITEIYEGTSEVQKMVISSWMLK